MSKLTITLRVAGGNYSFTIDSAQEELYRKAERMVNMRMKEFNNINSTQQTQLALAALDISLEYLRLKQERSMGEDLDNLGQIDATLDQYLGEVK